MVKKDLISNASKVLRDNNIRKRVTTPAHVFHISDDDGNQKDFKVKKTDKDVLYTVEDIERILDACIFVIQEAMKSGEEIAIHGFGKMMLRYRSPKTVRNVLDGNPVQTPGGYFPRFVPGNDLMRAAHIYEQYLKDRKINEPLPIFAEEAGENDGD